MLFNYNVGFDRNGEMVPFIEIDYRHLKSEEDWMALRDIIGEKFRSTATVMLSLNP